MKRHRDGENLADFLDEQVFRHPHSVTRTPNQNSVDGCNSFIMAYKKALPVESLAGRVVAE
jgi:L-ribulokinase